jgi:hypothetical protein
MLSRLAQPIRRIGQRGLVFLATIAALAASVGVVASSAAAATNIVINPGFEEGLADWSGGELIAGSVSPASRSNSAGEYQTQEGLKAIDLNTSSPTSTTQTVTTSPGIQYELKYWMAANAYDPNFCNEPLGSLPPTGQIRTMEVLWSGVQVSGSPVSFNPNGTSGGEPLSEWNMGWEQHTALVTGGPGGSDTLTFASTGPQNPCGPTLDNVSVDIFGGPAPSVTQVLPAKGPAAGTTKIVITGLNFSGATAVKFGSSAATSYTVASATSIKAVAPAGTARAVDVLVTAPSGTSAPTTADHYKYGPPTVTKVTPGHGPKGTGATTVLVTGTGFGLGSEATLFKFGSVEATMVNCTSMTSCSVAVPSSSVAATVDVKATVSGQNSPKAAADQFKYE